MDVDEQAQREAEHKAAALHNLGWEVGAGAAIWVCATRDVLDLHESARARWAEGNRDREAWDRLHGTALVLVVAIDQVLAFERRVRRVTGDAELARARARFDAACPHAEELRDLIAHLDAYVVGEGQRQTGRRLPPLDGAPVSAFMYWGNGGGTMLNLGDRTVNLRTAASAAIELAEVVERVRARQLERVEQEANAALHRRYGLPPE